MIQFLADQLDQLDLALDQLALKDRNFDRFALMLIDNVVELTLHQHAQDIRLDVELYRPDDGPRYDPKVVAAAFGSYFDAKVKLARTTGLVTGELADTLQYLHGFRNTAYHRGARHEGILRALALFYARSACQVLSQFEPSYFMSISMDHMPHRVVKYLGAMQSMLPRDAFKQAWQRLDAVAAHQGDTLIADLRADMEKTVEGADEQITFLAVNTTAAGIARDEVILDCQVWPFAYSEQGQDFAATNGGPDPSTPGYVAWIEQHYSWPHRADPIPSWRNRAALLAAERNPHVALKKYCEFMNQTEALRTAIDTTASQLDAHIENAVDSMREERHLDL
ncbi:hypothetical protein [Ralstonia pseudosolanacearum]|uniref:Uncharacterized protein n=1 Tax=Ralstonia solanacearum TaxID=305 RepID=A0AA92K5N7_RALSL|nr:hypothetical protein [Ralstonia pseudosolanacearum]QOK98844.1 hypothetical protein HF909_20700 [Ralstonia pseudosolanacearum]UWD88212.1 hypothetical protein NY025_05730 [Ralstonia pseudosolanacearum]CAH0439963.1 hypothetical protein LMG9673_00746 [Ralstonia pseudosolanacearum]